MESLLGLKPNFLLLQACHSTYQEHQKAPCALYGQDVVRNRTIPQTEDENIL